MTATAQSNKACDLILFGTKGDLARRKLLPALYQLERASLLHVDSRIIGVARDGLSLTEYVELVETNLQKFIKEPIEADVWQRLKAKLVYVQIDLSQEADYLKLKEVTDPAKRIPVSYFATAPSLFGNICKGLDAADLLATNPTTAPYQRISFSKKRLVAGRAIYLHLVGAKKLQVLEQAAAGTDVAAMPIRAFIQLTAPELSVMYADQ